MLSHLHCFRLVFAIAILELLSQSSFTFAAPDPTPIVKIPASPDIAPTPKPAPPLGKVEVLPSSDPLDLVILDQLRKGTCETCAATSSLPEGLSAMLTSPQVQPSLWWYRDQAKPGLIENWLVYQARSSQPARVDFILNRSLWSAMDYLERYAFINAMGTATSRFGFNSRFFQLQQASQMRLATYTCDFQNQPSACQLVVESIGLNRFR